MVFGSNEPTFGDVLRRYRVSAALTQEALAERSGISLRGLSDLERGVRRAPYQDTIRRLACALGLGDAETAALLTRRWTQGSSTRIEPVPARPAAGGPHPPSAQTVVEDRRLLVYSHLHSNRTNVPSGRWLMSDDWIMGCF